jgi:hypothetical protein
MRASDTHLSSRGTRVSQRSGSWEGEKAGVHVQGKGMSTCHCGGLQCWVEEPTCAKEKPRWEVKATFREKWQGARCDQNVNHSAKQLLKEVGVTWHENLKSMRQKDTYGITHPGVDTAWLRRSLLHACAVWHVTPSHRTVHSTLATAQEGDIHIPFYREENKPDLSNLLLDHTAGKWQSQALNSTGSHTHDNDSILSLLLETRRQSPII